MFCVFSACLNKIQNLFDFQDCWKRSSNESKLAIQGNNVLLGSQGSNEMVIDISRSPLAEFHGQERENQGKPVEVSKFCPYIPKQLS